jgi:hypothetical protein
MMTSLRKAIFPLLFLPFLGVATSGCIPLWVGAGVAGVVGGYAVSPDTVQGQVSRSLNETWDASKEIVGIMGQIVEENQQGNQLVGMISGTRVTVSFSAINVSTTKLSVKARKSFVPKIDVAQDVYAKIVNSMEK